MCEKTLHVAQIVNTETGATLYTLETWFDQVNNYKSPA